MSTTPPPFDYTALINTYLTLRSEALKDNTDALVFQFYPYTSTATSTSSSTTNNNDDNAMSLDTAPNSDNSDSLNLNLDIQKSLLLPCPLTPYKVPYSLIKVNAPVMIKALESLVRLITFYNNKVGDGGGSEMVRQCILPPFIAILADFDIDILIHKYEHEHEHELTELKSALGKYSEPGSFVNSVTMNYKGMFNVLCFGIGRVIANCEGDGDGISVRIEKLMELIDSLTSFDVTELPFTGVFDDITSSSSSSSSTPSPSIVSKMKMHPPFLTNLNQSQYLVDIIQCLIDLCVDVIVASTSSETVRTLASEALCKAVFVLTGFDFSAKAENRCQGHPLSFSFYYLNSMITHNKTLLTSLLPLQNTTTSNTTSSSSTSSSTSTSSYKSSYKPLLQELTFHLQNWRSKHSPALLEWNNTVFNKLRVIVQSIEHDILPEKHQFQIHVGLPYNNDNDNDNVITDVNLHVSDGRWACGDLGGDEGGDDGNSVFVNDSLILVKNLLSFLLNSKPPLATGSIGSIGAIGNANNVHVDVVAGMYEKLIAVTPTTSKVWLVYGGFLEDSRTALFSAQSSSSSSSRSSTSTSNSSDNENENAIKQVKAHEISVAYRSILNVPWDVGLFHNLINVVLTNGNAPVTSNLKNLEKVIELTKGSFGKCDVIRLYCTGVRVEMKRILKLQLDIDIDIREDDDFKVKDGELKALLQFGVIVYSKHHDNKGKGKGDIKGDIDNSEVAGALSDLQLVLARIERSRSSLYPLSLKTTTNTGTSTSTNHNSNNNTKHSSEVSKFYEASLKLKPSFDTWLEYIDYTLYHSPSASASASGGGSVGELYSKVSTLYKRGFQTLLFPPPTKKQPKPKKGEIPRPVQPVVPWMCDHALADFYVKRWLDFEKCCNDHVWYKRALDLIVGRMSEVFEAKRLKEESERLRVREEVRMEIEAGGLQENSSGDGGNKRARSNSTSNSTSTHPPPSAPTPPAVAVEEEVKHFLKVGALKWPAQPYTVYVSNLTYKTTELDLLPIFKKFGALVHIRVIRDKKTSVSKGTALVQYEDKGSVEGALELDRAFEVCGREVRVERSQFAAVASVCAIPPKVAGGFERGKKFDGAKKGGEKRKFESGSNNDGSDSTTPATNTNTNESTNTNANESTATTTTDATATTAQPAVTTAAKKKSVLMFRPSNLTTKKTTKTVAAATGAMDGAVGVENATKVDESGQGKSKGNAEFAAMFE